MALAQLADNPFIPKEPKYAIIDGRASEEIEANLKKLNLKVFRTLKCPYIYESISYHPDIVFHPVKNGLIVASEMYNDYLKLFNGEINLIKGESLLGKKYPENIPLNIARIKNYALHLIKYTDSLAKKILEAEGIKFVDIKQGYSKCSLGLLASDIGITSDIGIKKALDALNIKCLLIEPGHIKLAGEKYGFIGGAMGNLNEDTILFTGHINNHPSKDDIINFISKLNKNVIYLSNDEITDLGSIIIGGQYE